jgi:hypothetical protein
MSCWVVPSVAAELWGCPVQSVLDAIRGGDVPTREENGWMFVDVAPDSPTLQTPKALRPATYVSDAELAALTGPIDDYDVALEIAEDDQDLVYETHMIDDWREARVQTATMRRAPVAKAA